MSKSFHFLLVFIFLFTFFPPLLVQAEPGINVTSMVDCEARQRVMLTGWDAKTLGTPATLAVFHDGKLLAESDLNILTQDYCAKLRRPGDASPMDYEPLDVTWVVKDPSGKTLKTFESTWTRPREWTIYMISSTHCDIGLHNSQYHQRRMSVQYAEKVAQLADQTNDRPEASRYRYMMEGTWFWGNYEQDRGELAAREYVQKYVLPGRVGIGCTAAGNHTQSYGFEELCRSAYGKQALTDRWGIQSDTMVMSDNNGITWSLVGPYCEAGIRNILFNPNQWNPLPSTIWKMREDVPGGNWNPDAHGGGSRIDVSYDSPLPMVFYWQGVNPDEKILVWCSTQYDKGGWRFGVLSHSVPSDWKPMVEKMGRQLTLLEGRYPFDLWVFPGYSDDEAPSDWQSRLATAWNEKWINPKLRTTGNLSEPFNLLRERFDAQIPVLRGDMTCSWAQHTICAPEILAQKFHVDRALPTAEKLASLAAMNVPGFAYPSVEFRRAWDQLIWNDEHSYGVSGYQGRRVYETWLQHRDWVDKAEKTAADESQRALTALAQTMNAPKGAVVVFNPSTFERSEILEVSLPDGQKVRFRTPKLAPMSVTMIRRAGVPAGQETGTTLPASSDPTLPPTIENRFYRVKFAADGSIASIFDKELNRELIDPNAPYRANQFVYTQDNHRTFVSPERAAFTVSSDEFGVTVTAKMDEPHSQAAITQTVFLPNDEKWISLDNQMNHVRDLINKNRYYRYGYYAFPFDVPDGKFHVELNGVMAEPKKDVTGHGTDVYLAARDFAGVQNADFGVELIQLDSHLVEFGRIAPDKTDFGKPLETTHLYSYIFTDWLQMHKTGGSYVNPRFRYVLTSHRGTFAEAQIPRLAERFTTPLVWQIAAGGTASSGNAPALPADFSALPANVTLLTLKRAENPDGGFIARFHETTGQGAVIRFPNAVRCTVTEQPIPDAKPTGEFMLKPFGFLTLRFAPAQKIASTVQDLKAAETTDVSVRLTWKPAAAPELGGAMYRVYRGEFAGFAPDAFHLVKTVAEPEFTDVNLNPGTAYFYRVQPEIVSGSPKLGEVSAVLEAPTLEVTPEHDSDPAPIGSLYTGLVSEPKAATGEADDLLYLEWGQNMESDFSHYELYRSTEKGFTPDEKTFVTNVERGEYRMGLYADRGLGEHTTYYYRVRAVDKAGHKSPFSPEFSGTTKEN
ncbi:MAG: glycoside hydrolase family 38 C-terminal domain-containing protein [Thermoguttaceae bacterium]|nr:glycoside hydrolase family 38 C-terminal domain-containing protein [Thermoguttaceae bacterium]